MIDRRILSLIGLFGVSALLQKVQCNYAEPINLHDLKTTSLTSSSGSDGGAGRSRCLLQNVIDMRQSYDSIAAVADASDGAATSTSLKPSADENSMETNAHIYNGHYQRDNIQTIRYKTLNIQGTGNSKSKTLAYSPSKGEILVHRPAAIVVKRPPTKVIVNHPPLVVKPPPVVLHKPPAVVVRKVYVKEHPRPVKVEPVYVNVVKPPAEKYFVNEKQQSNVRHHDEQHEQLQHLTQQEYLQQHQYEAEPLSTGISYKPLTIAANSNAHPHHYRVETMTSALKHDDSYYHMTSADNSELNRLLHTENSSKDGDANYDIPPSISLSKMQHDTNASSY